MHEYQEKRVSLYPAGSKWLRHKRC